ncbi:MAG: phosphotriesterase [Mariniphaga sp.]|nr:phosphotriesterase [Mariniphaga sp.]
MKPSLFKTALGILLLFSLLPATSCRNNNLKIVTVTGEIPVSKMGVTLPNEHVLVDFASIDSVGMNHYNRDSVIAKVLPYFEELKQYNVKTFVDGTPEFMGRDPQLLAELSRKTGIQILTNTGWMASDEEKHLPKEFKDMSAEEIAAVWIDEAKNGIGNTGIKPGFIKIGLNKVELTETDKKLVAAACLTHLETGLTIMSFTGPAEAALEQLTILKKYGVDPSAFIWSHAMEEVKSKKILAIALMGAWIGLDGIQNDMMTQIQIERLLQNLKATRQLGRLLLSHDAGWYQPGKPNGGVFRPYSDLFSSFSLLLQSEGFTREELDQMTIKNPAEAFAVRVRKITK